MGVHHSMEYAKPPRKEDYEKRMQSAPTPTKTPYDYPIWIEFELRKRKSRKSNRLVKKRTNYKIKKTRNRTQKLPKGSLTKSLGRC
jgi:hypothetical protein